MDAPGLTLLLNGLDATTGAYLDPGLAAADLARGVRRPGLRDAAEAVAWRQALTTAHLGPREGIDPQDLAAAGWGVVFPQGGGDPAVREALAPLLEHRRHQAAARDERRFREWSGAEGYRAGESKGDFLRRQGAGPGPVDPRKVPYYLLLVGDPQAIPFDVQCQLDVPHAIGRLAFDTPEEYARYGEAVVAAETGSSPANRQAVLFGVKNPGDRVTWLTSRYLVERLAAFLAADQPAWKVEGVLAEAATRERLGRLLGGGETPAFLFTAGHGVGFPAGCAGQRELQGALLCQDWPGPQAWQGPLARDHYFAAEDLAGNPAGLISFHYSCHGAGTPAVDGSLPAGDGPPLAPFPFVARLPQRLLAGGALAVVGHVDRAWCHSFLWEGAGAQTQVFEDTFKRLLEGHTVGSALDPFGRRYADLEAELADERSRLAAGKPADPELLARLTTAAHDARNYVVLGDPAVRLP